MTTSRSPKPNPRPGLPMIAATTAALPAVVLSSLAIAQPAAAEPAPGPSRRPWQRPCGAGQGRPTGRWRRPDPGRFRSGRHSGRVPAGPGPRPGGLHDRPRRHDQRHCRQIRPGHQRGPEAEQAAGQHRHLPRAEDQAQRLGRPPRRRAGAPAAAARCRRQRLHGKAGDTLGAIAARHGVKLSEVFGWNGLNMGSIIYPGQKIKIGAGARGSGPCSPGGSGSHSGPGPASSGSYTLNPATPSRALRPGTASGSPTSSPPTTSR